MEQDVDHSLFLCSAHDLKRYPRNSLAGLYRDHVAFLLCLPRTDSKLCIHQAQRPDVDAAQMIVLYDHGVHDVLRNICKSLLRIRHLGRGLHTLPEPLKDQLLHLRDLFH